MKILQLTTFFLFISTVTFSQNLIGYKEDEIRKYMRENRKDMNYASVTNSRFKYLKYTDNNDNETLLFFLNNSSVCKSERIICDYSIKNQKIKELNERYKKIDDNSWLDVRGRKNYTIELKDEQWSCIITIVQAK
jgi:hypothetical protein